MTLNASIYSADKTSIPLNVPISRPILCQLCADLFTKPDNAKLLRPGSPKIHIPRNISILKISAQGGCYLCAILWHDIEPHADAKDEESEIRISISASLAGVYNGDAPSEDDIGAIYFNHRHGSVRFHVSAATGTLKSHNSDTKLK